MWHEWEAWRWHFGFAVYLASYASAAFAVAAVATPVFLVAASDYGATACVAIVR